MCTLEESVPNKNGDIMWDVSPTKLNKAYKYIPELMKAILEECKLSVQNLKHHVALSQEHPANIQQSHTLTISDKTAELVTNKCTRFA